jgi:hypothetical protein
MAYVWHYGLPVASLHIAKGHLRALILVDMEFGVIDVGDFIEGHFQPWR